MRKRVSQSQARAAVGPRTRKRGQYMLLLAWQIHGEENRLGYPRTINDPTLSVALSNPVRKPKLIRSASAKRAGVTKVA